MDSNVSGDRILYLWDEYNIFIYIIPALLFFLLLSPVVISNSNILGKIGVVLSYIDSQNWPLALLYIFVISCILYIVGNVIASLSTFVLGKIVSIESIGNPDEVALEGLNMTPSAVRLRYLILFVDLLLLLLSIPLIFNSKIAIITKFIILCLSMSTIMILYILKNIKKNKEEERKRKSKFDKCLEIILGKLPDEVIETFKERFKEIFKIKEQKREKYTLALSRIYIQNNYPSVFLQIKRYHMLYSFSQNVTGSFLFALLFYIIFYAFVDLNIHVTKWLGLFIWFIGKIFLIRYLRTYYNTYCGYIVKAFVAVRSSKEKK